MSLLLESFRPDQFLLSSLGVSNLEEVRTFRWRGLTQVRCRELLLRSRDPSDNGMRVCLPLLRISSVFRTFAGYLVRSLCRFPTLPRTARHGTARLGGISGSCVSRGPDAGTVDLDLPRRSLRVGPTTSSSSHRPKLHGFPGRSLFHSWPPRLCPNPRWCFPSLLEHLDFTCELSSMDVLGGRRWPTDGHGQHAHGGDVGGRTCASGGMRPSGRCTWTPSSDAGGLCGMDASADAWKGTWKRERKRKRERRPRQPTW